MVSEGNPKEVDERQLSLPRNVINFSNTWRLVGDIYFPAVLSQYEKNPKRFVKPFTVKWFPPESLNYR